MSKNLRQDEDFTYPLHPLDTKSAEKTSRRLVLGHHFFGWDAIFAKGLHPRTRFLKFQVRTLGHPFFL